MSSSYESEKVILSRTMIEDFLSKGEKPYSNMNPDEVRKLAYKTQFEETLRTMANGLVIHAKFLNKSGKIDPERCSFTPFIYKWKDPSEFNKVKSLTPYLEELIGPKDKVVDILKKTFETAFPGFGITVIDQGTPWTYSVEFDYYKN